jgi:acetolactate synthase-1/2/3 large subunit
MKKAASIFIKTLINHNVDRFFCVPGESYLPVMDELISSKDIDVVSCRHEGGAGFMALADAKCTGKAGIAFVSRGPGATNVSIAVHSAHQGGIPMIIFIGQVNRKSIGKMHLQEIDFTKMFSDISKHVEQIINPEEIANVTAKAFKIAESGTPGPVVISIPSDVLDSKVLCSPQKRAEKIIAKSDIIDIRQVANEILIAKKPILVVGGHLQFLDYSKSQIKKIASKFLLPVLCTYEHQDLIDNDSVHYAGELGLRPPEPVKKNATEADLVLCIGHRLNGIPNLGYTFPSKKQKFIHVLPDGKDLENIFKTDLGIISDGNDFMEKLLKVKIKIVEKNRNKWIKTCNDRYKNNKSTQKPRSANDGMDFAHLIDKLGTLAPKNSIITNDAGNFTSWMHHRFPFKSSMKLLGSEIGAMGMGIPAGIAASIRYPNRMVFSLVGDGGALMTGSELATAVAKKAKLKIIVANNNHYGTIRYHQEVHYPNRNHYATNLVNPDFKNYAESFGVKGFKIETIDEIENVLKQAINEKGPVLIEFNMSLELNTSTTTLSELQ